MDFGITGFLINLIVSIIIISPILWLVGRSMVGKDKAKFTDAIWIVVLGVILGAVIGRFIHGWFGFLVTLLIWLFLIKRFFDTGWGRAFFISIMAVIILIVIAFILALIGITVFTGLLGRLPI